MYNIYNIYIYIHIYIYIISVCMYMYICIFHCVFSLHFSFSFCAVTFALNPFFVIKSFSSLNPFICYDNK